MHKLLTISIAAYNAEPYLEKCLSSLVSSTKLDLMEVIVVNDGSTDNTLMIANEFKNKYPQIIKVIDKSNGGHGSTINAAINEATGKYFKTLDADDWFDTKKLDLLINYIEKSKDDTDMIINNHTNYNKISNKQSVACPIIDIDKVEYNVVYNFDDVCDKFQLAMANITFKTECLKKMKEKIDENCFYVDVEYTIFPLLYVNKIIFLNYSVYMYLIGQGGQSTNLKVMQNRENQHFYVIKQLWNYYSSKKGLTTAKKELIYSRILNMLYVQYIIYLTMNNKSGKEKLILLESWILSNSKKMYEDIIPYSNTKNRYYSQIISFLRKHQFHFYYITMFFMNGARFIRKTIKGER